MSPVIRASAVQDLRDAVGRDADPSGEFGSAHVESVQFFCEVFAWVDGVDWHSGLLVIVDNFNVRRARRAIGPLEADSPLIVDADTELALAVAAQRSNRLPGNTERSLSDVAASRRSSLSRAERSNAANALMRLPTAKCLVRLSRKLTIMSNFSFDYELRQAY